MMMSHDDTFCFLKTLVTKARVRKKYKRKTMLATSEYSMVDLI